MLNALARILLTSSAIAPVGLTYAWVAYTQNDLRAALYIAIGSLATVAICLMMLRYAKKNLEITLFQASEVEAADRENMGFLLLYLLPLFTSQFNTLNWQLWIPTLGIFAIITATGYNYHFNPLLGILRWHFYKVKSREGVTYVLITKKQIRSAANPISVGQLTEYILIDLEDA
ncbi:hypothetical protein [Sphingomonas parapaucimobilis]|uniref:Uncharacterized protein n=1 Tax=Sphingomonas parapaucimobilis NBRC 15100 TaxID=1219049 RepID=A0A0A1WBW0_9SPHN|nr:hypothetical protein [Sphingomonas parapaucimobilis]GAM02833.1 hypothetical protein SP5_099_00480 [Sphingomonas parapaucimobilis NBRC 15100]